MTSIVEGSTNIYQVSFSQVKQNNYTRINSLFVLEKVLQRIGFIHPSLNPTENSLAIDPFLGGYTKFDLIFVVTFLYLGLVEKKSIRVPRNHRTGGTLLSKKRVSEVQIANKNQEKEYYNQNSVSRKYLREKWRIIEHKISCHRVQFLENLQVKSKKVEGKEELHRFTRARHDAFEEWKKLGQVYDSDDESEMVQENMHERDEMDRRLRDLESGKTVNIGDNFVEW